MKEDLKIAANLLCDCYTQSRYIPPDDDWPPYHPKHYTPWTIIHHEGRSTKSEIAAVAQKFRTTDITEEHTGFTYVCHKTTKSINKLVASFEGTESYPYIILIEGAPGIGKTMLSKELAFQWARKNILNNKNCYFCCFCVILN